MTAIRFPLCPSVVTVLFLLLPITTYQLLIASFVHPSIMYLHPVLRTFERREAKLLIESMCITRDQGPSPQSLQIRMALDALHQPLGKTLSAVRFHHKDVSDVSKRSLVGNDTCKSYLLTTMVDAETE